VEKIKLGISSCLLGLAVRYDGGHKLDPLLMDTLGKYAEWVPVCPEVECGLPVPREPMGLAGNPRAPRLVTLHSNIDHRGRMLTWAKSRLEALREEKLCGFVFKSRSPSCALRGIALSAESGMPNVDGQGIFARAFMEKFPDLPVEDEVRLSEPELRKNFLERVSASQR
jgi:uncharacterized protein YbbK (DUF523 family)